MKLTQCVLATVVAVLGMAGAAPAVRAADAAPPAPAAPAAGEGRLAERRELIEDVKQALESLNLGADEKAKIKDAVEDFRKRVEQFRAAHKDELQPLIKDLLAAREAKNAEQVKTDLEKIRAILETGPKPLVLLEKIRSILGPEQLKAFREEMRKLRGEEQNEAAAATQK